MTTETYAVADAKPSLPDSLVDRLNPILVREVRQAMKGRVFAATVLLALCASVVIAAVVAADFVDGRGSGRHAFDAGFATLVPLIVFVVPMQAFHSMRTEMRGGIVEQLLMSRMSPGAVLIGKLQAAMVQWLLYVSVMSPLLATSYLLRGVDLPMIAVSLLLALVLCLAATAFAISAAAQAVVPAMQAMSSLAVALGLGIGTFALVSMTITGGYGMFVGMLLRSGAFATVLSGILLGASLSITMSWLTARSYLLHAFENRSTAFRVFLLLLPVILCAWLLGFVDARVRGQYFVVLLIGLLLVGGVFGVFMVTEQQRLSPRVRAHVPATTVRAWLLGPLLPGRDRGMHCMLLYLAMLVVIGVVGWPTAGLPIWLEGIDHVFWMAAVYVLVFVAIARWLRGRLPDRASSNQLARVGVVALLFLSILAPVLIDVMTIGGVRRWHIGHVTNPFWTIAEFAGAGFEGARSAFASVAAVLVVAQLPACLRGVREVVESVLTRRRLLASTRDGQGGGQPGTGAAADA